MLTRSVTRAGTQRRGVILLVVLALLTLFAIVGLSFVFYSDAEATSSRVAREAQTMTRAGSDSQRSTMDATTAWNTFLGQLIYDVNDDSFGVLSALRGHSLARTMYGWNDPQLYASAPAPNTQFVYQSSDKPYCGTGRLGETIALGGGNTMNGQDAVNYMYFPGDKWGLRDPGRQGTRAFVPPYVPGQPYPTDNRGQLVGDVNVPYTYPDQNNMFLAMIDPSSGQVMVPSYYRNWKFGVLNNPFPNTPASNQNWLNTQGKYYSMRPRPADMGDPTGANFPYPQADTDGVVRGDVRNLDWAPPFGNLTYSPQSGGLTAGSITSGGNDSIWIDINAPVITLPDGTQYKMLVAPLIIDLDGRINMNVAGNIMATVKDPSTNKNQLTHASNQGWGPYEVSLSRVLDYITPANPPNTVPTEWQNVFLGNTTYNNLPVHGRYSLPGVSGTPLPITALPVGGTQLRAYYPMDYNGIYDTGKQGSPGLSGTNNPPGFAWSVPFQNANPSIVPYQLFPYYDSNAYGNASPNETAAPNPVHASIYNPFRPSYDPNNSQNYNIAFTYNDLSTLLRRGTVGAENLTSPVLDLLPNNLAGQPTGGNSLLDLSAAYRRALLTTHSFDLDRPGVLPYSWDPGTNAPTQRYQYPPSGLPTTLYPGAKNGATFPNVTSPLPPVPSGSEFDASTWQSILSVLGRVDLTRKLTNWPALVRNEFNTADPLFVQAVQDRQNMAADIFSALWRSTGAVPPDTAADKTKGYGPNSPEFLALQWLAQLAANIVDFIDYDDYNTAFNWYPLPGTAGIAGVSAQWVFGTEMPRLVINEYYAQWDNDAADVGPAPNSKAKVNNRVNVWVELYNPFPPDAADPQNGTVQLYNGRPEGNRRAGGGYSIYQLLLCQGPNTQIRSMTNTLGQTDKDFGVAGAPTYTTVGGNAPNSWGTTLTTQTITPGFQASNGGAGSNAGFYVVGPRTTPAVPANSPNNVYRAPLTTANPNLTTTFASNNMSYNLPLATDPGMAANAPSIVLQRLANPYLPPQTNAGAANYNPYITVDYVPQVYVNNGRLYDTNGATANPAPAFGSRYSFGRRQPFSAACTTTSNPNPDKILNPALPNPWQVDPTLGLLINGDTTNSTFGQWVRAASPVPPPAVATQPCNTFYGQNINANAPPQTLYYFKPKTAANPAVISSSFDVQYHPDRVPISLADLLHVSGFKMHEFTQQFVDTQGNKFAQRAPWSDDTARIMRVFDLLTISGRTNGPAKGGRIPGKININTAWDLLSSQTGVSGDKGSRLFQALSDPQKANLFYSTKNGDSLYQVKAIWDALIQNRSPDTSSYTYTSAGQPVTVTVNVPGKNSRPFWSLGMGYTTAPDLVTPGGTRGMGNTTFTPAPGATATATNPPTQADLSQLRLLEPSTDAAGNAITLTNQSTQAIQRFELLSKILGNLTTRSNTFAVWVTIGFFKVNNANSRPVQLGAEYIWPTTQAPIRHKFFAIIDRTQLQVWPTYNANSQPMVTSASQVVITNPATSVTAGVNLVDAGGNPITPAVVPPPKSPNGVVNPNTNRTWYLPPASPVPGQPPPANSAAQYFALLTYEPDTDNEETVTATSDGKGGYQATFYKQHPDPVKNPNGTVVVISRGNPGPWTVPYNPSLDSAVVPYSAQIN